MDNLSSVLNTLVLVAVVAALAQLIVALLPGPRVPQIVSASGLPPSCPWGARSRAWVADQR
jgi:hypothetical protein